MAIAETARLVVALELQDKFSGPAKNAANSLGGLGKAGGVVSSGFGLIGRGAGAVGNAFNTLKGRIGSLLTGPLGMLGLGAGLFSVFGFLKGGIDQARDFGKEVGRLSALTGLGAESTSRLAGAFEHYGIAVDDAILITGLAEKNLFKLGGTAKEAKNFQDKYGLSLVDASGKLKDFNTLLLDTADFWNTKTIPAAQKAAALAAIYGRSWQTLIPILGAGRQAISDAEDEAAKLGLTLTKDNLDALGRLKTATRDWGTALGGLKLQLGLAVVPLLTDLTTAATNFLKATDQFGRTGSQRIVSFFKDLIQFGKNAYATIQTQVVPLVKKVIDGWNNLPAPLKSLLVKGAAGNFTIKFLLGFSPIALAEQAAGVVAGKIAGVVAGGLAKSFGGFLGDLFGRTAAQKLIPQAIVPASGALPVFVTNPGFGLPGGGGGAPIGGVKPPGGLPPIGLGTLAAAAALFAGVGFIIVKAEEESRTAAGKRAIEEHATFSHWGGILDKNSAALQSHSEAIKENTKAHKETGSRSGRTPGAVIRAGIHGPLLVKLDDKALIAALAKTSEFGFKGIGTAIEHGILAGTDPFGREALALFRRAEFPRQGKTLGEIQRHIIAAEEVQRQYLARGDINSAKQIQATIDGLHQILGSTDKTPLAISAAAARQQATADRLTHLLEPVPAGIAAIAAKPVPSFIANIITKITARLSVTQALYQQTLVNQIRKDFSPGDSTGGSL